MQAVEPTVGHKVHHSVLHKPRRPAHVGRLTWESSMIIQLSALTGVKQKVSSTCRMAAAFLASLLAATSLAPSAARAKLWRSSGAGSGSPA